MAVQEPARKLVSGYFPSGGRRAFTQMDLNDPSVSNGEPRLIGNVLGFPDAIGAASGAAIAIPLGVKMD